LDREPVYQELRRSVQPKPTNAPALQSGWKGLSGSLSGGIFAGGGGQVCIVSVATPDGKMRLGYTRSFDWGTEGFKLGGAVNLGSMRSNADDIGQLAGMGHDAGGSLRAGPGIYGNHETAIRTTNSKGRQVSSIEVGTGWGIGAELYNGFNRTWSDWL
ncbi:hypothetical protein ACIQ7Q_34890, partial [Streptomyces sp. NPDC096176]|uniref:hypothetical protein n=1 Tax=Streptomyces sp. NPDC096176 TaxID=3366079 RepID=UPI0038168C00